MASLFSAINLPALLSDWFALHINQSIKPHYRPQIGHIEPREGTSKFDQHSINADCSIPSPTNNVNVSERLVSQMSPTG